MDQQSFVFQSAHRIAHRRAAHLQPFGDFGFHDARTRLECSSLNCGVQFEIRTFSQRRVLGGFDVG
jgi:hypothetical protein